MNDLELEYRFTDRGGSKVYDVMKQATEYLPEDNLGQVRIPDDPRIAELEAALKTSVVAIDDWLNTYAAELCDEDRVNEAKKRIMEYGTIGYIAHIQEANRKALEQQA